MRALFYAISQAYKMEIVSTMREIRSLNPMFKEQLELFLQTADLNNPDKSGMLADIAAQLTSADGQELQDVINAFSPLALTSTQFSFYFIRFWKLLTLVNA